MPRSRKRRSRHHLSSRTRSAWSELSPYLATMMLADEAEARGDAREALAIITSQRFGPDGKPFWRPWRIRRLEQLVDLEPYLPKWVVSRWVLDPALQALPTRHRQGRAMQALEVAVDMRGGLGSLPGVDDVARRCKVIDHDWVFRQLYLYDLGALTIFLRDTAAPDLLVGADQIEAWTKATMGGFRLERRTPGTITWRSLDAQRLVTLPNVGSAVQVDPGDHVIGRMVPIEGGSMFETAPLPVPHEVADRVACDPLDWVSALRETAPTIPTGGRDFGLVTDVPADVWYRTVTGRRATPLPVSAAGVAAATLRLARARLAGLDDEPAQHQRGTDAWACLAAALLEPGITGAVADAIGPGDDVLLLRLARELSEPAASVCGVLAADFREAA